MCARYSAVRPRRSCSPSSTVCSELSAASDEAKGSRDATRFCEGVFFFSGDYLPNTKCQRRLEGSDGVVWQGGGECITLKGFAVARGKHVCVIMHGRSLACWGWGLGHRAVLARRALPNKRLKARLRDTKPTKGDFLQRIYASLHCTAGINRGSGWVADDNVGGLVIAR